MSNLSQQQGLSSNLSMEKAERHYLKVPRQVSRQVKLVWGKKAKKQKSNKVAPSQGKDGKPKLKTMGSIGMETLSPRRTPSGHDLTRIYLDQYDLTYAYGGRPYTDAQNEFAKGLCGAK